MCRRASRAASGSVGRAEPSGAWKAGSGGWKTEHGKIQAAGVCPRIGTDLSANSKRASSLHLFLQPPPPPQATHHLRARPVAVPDDGRPFRRPRPAITTVLPASETPEQRRRGAKQAPVFEGRTDSGKEATTQQVSSHTRVRRLSAAVHGPLAAGRFLFIDGGGSACTCHANADLSRSVGNHQYTSHHTPQLCPTSLRRSGALSSNTLVSKITIHSTPRIIYPSSRMCLRASRRTRPLCARS